MTHFAQLQPGSASPHHFLQGNSCLPVEAERGKTFELKSPKTSSKFRELTRHNREILKKLDPRTIKTALWPLTEITLFADSVFSFVSYRIVLIVPNSFEIKSPGWITALSIEGNAMYTETFPKAQRTQGLRALTKASVLREGVNGKKTCNPQRAKEKREKLGAVIESIEKVLGQKIVIIIVTYITFTFCQHLMLSKFQIAKNREI